MRETHLILVEGLPGSGKSTAAAWIAERLRAENREVRLFMESEPGHPLNVGGDSHPAGDTPGGEFFRRYTPESDIQESLEKWQRFAAAAVEDPAIFVLDSYPFQNSARVLLQLDAGRDPIRRYAGQVEALVMPLHPFLVYFSRRDPEDAMRQFKNISTQRGEAWTNYVVDLVLDCPYAANQQLKGFEGVMTFMKDYYGLILDLLGESQFPRLVLDDCADDWRGCYQRLGAFLKTSLESPESAP
jgi:hypothetical protein